MDKEIIDIPEDKIGNPCKPGFVIFLVLEKIPGEEKERYMEIALGRIDENIITSFKGINGVKKVILIHGRLFPMLRLLLEKDAHIVTKVQELCNNSGVPIIYTLKGKTKPPDFNAVPKLNEMSKKDGIFELSQNILNAHNSAFLEETLSGSRPRMIFELAGLMENARFFTLTVGKLPEMVRLVEELTR